MKCVCISFSGVPERRTFYNSGKIKPFLRILASAVESSYVFIINVIIIIMLEARKKKIEKLFKLFFLFSVNKSFFLCVHVDERFLMAFL